MAPDLTDLIGPKKSSATVPTAGVFAKIKKTATLRNKESSPLLRSGASIFIYAYAKEQRASQRA